jgi:hypothetical protein
MLQGSAWHDDSLITKPGGGRYPRSGSGDFDLFGATPGSPTFALSKRFGSLSAGFFIQGELNRSKSQAGSSKIDGSPGLKAVLPGH